MVDVCQNAEFEINVMQTFESKVSARIAYDVLKVDSQPKRSKTTRTLEYVDGVLKAQFVSTDLKNLRVAVNSYFDSLVLINKTASIFGPPSSDSYSHYK